MCIYTAAAAATAAKLLQSCPTLCDPIDGSPRGSPIFPISINIAHTTPLLKIRDLKIYLFLRL